MDSTSAVPNVISHKKVVEDFYNFFCVALNVATRESVIDLFKIKHKIEFATKGEDWPEDHEFGKMLTEGFGFSTVKETGDHLYFCACKDKISAFLKGETYLTYKEMVAKGYKIEYAKADYSQFEESIKKQQLEQYTPKMFGQRDFTKKDITGISPLLTVTIWDFDESPTLKIPD